MKIVKEDLRGCLNAMGVKERYWVVKVPISKTGICFDFATKEEAQKFIDNNTRRFSKEER